MIYIFFSGDFPYEKKNRYQTVRICNEKYSIYIDWQYMHCCYNYDNFPLPCFIAWGYAWFFQSERNPHCLSARPPRSLRHWLTGPAVLKSQESLTTKITRPPTATLVEDWIWSIHDLASNPTVIQFIDLISWYSGFWMWWFPFRKPKHGSFSTAQKDRTRCLFLPMVALITLLVHLLYTLVTESQATAISGDRV